MPSARQAVEDSSLFWSDCEYRPNNLKSTERCEGTSTVDLRPLALILNDEPNLMVVVHLELKRTANPSSWLREQIFTKDRFVDFVLSSAVDFIIGSCSPLVWLRQNNITSMKVWGGISSPPTVSLPQLVSDYGIFLCTCAPSSIYTLT